MPTPSSSSAGSGRLGMPRPRTTEQLLQRRVCASSVAATGWISTQSGIERRPVQEAFEMANASTSQTNPEEPIGYSHTFDTHRGMDSSFLNRSSLIPPMVVLDIPVTVVTGISKTVVVPRTGWNALPLVNRCCYTSHMIGSSLPTVITMPILRSAWEPLSRDPIPEEKGVKRLRADR